MPSSPVLAAVDAFDERQNEVEGDLRAAGTSPSAEGLPEEFCLGESAGGVLVPPEQQLDGSELWLSLDAGYSMDGLGAPPLVVALEAKVAIEAAAAEAAAAAALAEALALAQAQAQAPTPSTPVRSHEAGRDAQEWWAELAGWAESTHSPSSSSKSPGVTVYGYGEEDTGASANCFSGVLPGASAAAVASSDAAAADDAAGKTFDESIRRWPVFVCTQALFVTVLWLSFRLRDGTDLAGLESIWPGLTDLTLQEDCRDYRNQIWRWLAYQFTHAGAYHVGVNTLLLLVLGIPLERFHGSLRVASGFHIGVFGGACCYFVANNHSRVVGMSGGCYALIGMHAADILTSSWRRASSLRSLPYLLVICGLDVLQIFLFPSSSITYSAHFGGAVAGFLVTVAAGRRKIGLELPPPIPFNGDWWEDADLNPGSRRFGGLRCGRAVVLRFAALSLGLLLAVLCLMWGMAWPPRDIFERVPWCWDRQVVNRSLFGNARPHCVRCYSQACISRWQPPAQRNVRTVGHKQCTDLGGWAFTEN